MALNTIPTKQLLKEFNFNNLFIEELGWDNHNQTLGVAIDGKDFTLTAVAEKRGMVAFTCVAGDNGKIPPYPLRRKIEQQVAKSIHEHLIIYTDSPQTTQVWQWVRREHGKPSACREHTYHKTQPGDALVQKLQQISFSFEEEEGLTLIDVTGRVRAGLDVERVTKRFYERFKAEHASFLKFIKGIPEEDLHRWYASVMLNRLMFIYFIQKKGFLDNDDNYLRTKLLLLKQKGKDKFYTDFLCPLFFEGFAKKESERSSAMNQLLGKVPYLNGGLFMWHQIEELHGKTIQIADTAFEKIFTFFEQYQWHLDERPLRKDDEINPDVLGYIFEKYINQKQMGAYYTKEDITEYISKNTIIPFLFDAAQKKCKIAFEGQQSVWRLTKDDPDRYIYDAVKKGVDQPLPKEVAAGLSDVSKRTEWNKPAPEEYALPTEIWREVVARRKRYEEVQTKLAKEESTSINDFITYNLNIRQFAQDVIENSEGTELLRAFWHAIVGRVPEKSNEKFEQGITILDPTCGSGAFLFAALNILEPIYEACLDRMEVFIEELERSGEKHRSDKFGDFRKIIERIDQHPNRRYFILKSIIVNNLYGVDIMEEAIEICKLRLFLKLVAQIERVEDIEPLPDIDFNIRAGNTLVGFANREEVRKAITVAQRKPAEGKQQKIIFGEEADTFTSIEEKAEEIDRKFKMFQKMQTAHGMDAKDFTTAKKDLETKQEELEKELNHYLAKEYGIDAKSKNQFDKWGKSHQPYHWFIEFYGIMRVGGFDVIIGNPPYVEYDSEIQNKYKLNNYITRECGNLHAFLAERCLKSIASRDARIGLIVPLPSINTSRMSSLQQLIKPTFNYKSRSLWVSSFDERPSSLFTGVDQRLIIELFSAESDRSILSTTGINRWASLTRPLLLLTMNYAIQNKSIMERTTSILKIKNYPAENQILDKIYSNKPIQIYRSRLPTKNLLAYRTAGGRYWKVVLDKEFETQTASEKIAYLEGITGKQAAAIISSSTFWWYYSCYFDMYNLKDYMIFGFRFSNSSQETQEALDVLGGRLIKSLETNAEIKTIKSRTRGSVEQKLYIVSKSKPVIDEIDRVLAKHYDFTDEELDFIINYDIKYRMGLGGQDNQEEAD